MFFSDFNTFTQKPGVTALVTIADLPDPVNVDDEAMFDELEAAKTDEERAEIAQKYERAGNLENGLIQASTASYNRSGGYKDLYCGNYNIDIVEHDGECYVPLQTLNDLFMGPIYVSCVFNGQKMFALKYGSEMTGQIAEAEPAEMSERFSAFNFNELRLLLDTYYGLKEEHDIDNSLDFFATNPDLMTALLGTDSAQFDAALAEFLQVTLDDGHSGFGDVSWRTRAADGYDGMEIPEALLDTIAGGVRTQAEIEQAREVIRRYKAGGVEKDVLIGAIGGMANAQPGDPAFEEFKQVVESVWAEG